MRAHLTLILNKNFFNQKIKKQLEIQLNDGTLVTKYKKMKYWKDSHMVKIEAEIDPNGKLTEQKWKAMFTKFANIDSLTKDEDSMEIACYSKLFEPEDIFAVLYIPNSIIE